MSLNVGISLQTFLVLKIEGWKYVLTWSETEWSRAQERKGVRTLPSTPRSQTRGTRVQQSWVQQTWKPAAVIDCRLDVHWASSRLGREVSRAPSQDGCRSSPIGPRRQWEEPALLTRYCIYMDRFIDCFLSSKEHGLIDLRRHHNSDVYTNLNESRFMSRCTLRGLSAHLSIDGETNYSTAVSESFITL